MTHVFFLERADVSQALFWVGRFLVLIYGEVSFPDERSFFYLFDFIFEFCLRLYMDGYYFAECSGVQRGGAMGASAPAAREFDFYF